MLQNCTNNLSRRINHWNLPSKFRSPQILPILQIITNLYVQHLLGSSVICINTGRHSTRKTFLFHIRKGESYVPNIIQFTDTCNFRVTLHIYSRKNVHLYWFQIMPFELVFLVRDDHGTPSVWNSPYWAIRICLSILVPAQMNLIDYNENANYIAGHLHSQVTKYLKKLDAVYCLTGDY